MPRDCILCGLPLPEARSGRPRTVHPHCAEHARYLRRLNREARDKAAGLVGTAMGELAARGGDFLPGLQSGLGKLREQLAAAPSTPTDGQREAWAARRWAKNTRIP